MLKKIWAKLVLWTNNYCVKHGTRKAECGWYFTVYYCEACEAESAAKTQAKITQARESI